MTRKYTKHNCNYWGHVVRFIHTAIDFETGKIIAYYGICKRCKKKVFLERIKNNSGICSADMQHLADITLNDLPNINIKNKLNDQTPN